MLKIGIECHVQLLTNSKLFCSCPTRGNEGPNTRICPTCLGYPGAKPVLNKESVYKGIKIALALNCKLPREFYFSRKNYFYNDLVNNYQRTQYEISLAGEGYMDIEARKIRIRRINLEEDPGRLVHSGKDISKASYVLIDYNRAGIPLCEIVTEPDFTTTREVRIFLQRMSIILENYLKVFDSGLEGSLRVDANISTQGARVEIKNINSIESIGKAIDYEFERQSKEGGKTKETRRFDAVKGITMVMRQKESGEDYRFISDPDLQDIVIDKKIIDKLKEDIPESPDQKLQRFLKKHKISKYDAEVLSRNIDIAEFYEKVAERIDARFALPWISVGLFRLLNENKVKLDSSGVEIRVEDFVSLLNLIKSGKITELQGKQILKKFYPKSFDPSKKDIKEKITDLVEIEKIVKEKKDLGFNAIMGIIMSKYKGKVDGKTAMELIKKYVK